MAVHGRLWWRAWMRMRGRRRIRTRWIVARLRQVLLSRMRWAHRIKLVLRRVLSGRRHGTLEVRGLRVQEHARRAVLASREVPARDRARNMRRREVVSAIASPVDVRLSVLLELLLMRLLLVRLGRLHGLLLTGRRRSWHSIVLNRWVTIHLSTFGSIARVRLRAIRYGLRRIVRIAAVRCRLVLHIRAGNVLLLRRRHTISILHWLGLLGLLLMLGCGRREQLENCRVAGVVFWPTHT